MKDEDKALALQLLSKTARERTNIEDIQLSRLIEKYGRIEIEPLEEEARNNNNLGLQNNGV